MTEYKQIMFNKFYHPEFEGWVNINDEEIIISLIESKEKGKGNFRRYFEELKITYHKIIIPTPSIQMRRIALYLGFKCGNIFFQEPFNEKGEVLIYEREEMI